MSEYIAPVWMHKGQIVLSLDNQPVLDWPQVPATLSTKIEGWLQEFICRIHPQFALRDFLARMIPDHHRAAICMRRTRFRLRAGCLPWRTHQDNEEVEAFLDSLLPADCKRANSTKAFRDLSVQEMRQMKKSAKAQIPKSSWRPRPKRIAQRSSTASRPRQTSEEETDANSEKEDGENDEPSPGSASLDDHQINNPEIANQGANIQQRLVQESINQGLAGGHQQLIERQAVTTAEDIQEPEGPIHTEEATGIEIPISAQEPRHAEEPDYTDYRYVLPRTAFDEIAIVQALEPTRRQFWRLTGRNAQITMARDHYAAQWGALQFELDAFWMVNRSIGPAPSLAVAEEWLGGFEVFPIVPVPPNEQNFPEFQM